MLLNWRLIRACPRRTHQPQQDRTAWRGDAQAIRLHEPEGAGSLSDCRLTALQGKDQVFGMQLEFLQADFFELFVFGEIGLLQQFFQALSVAAMFVVQAIKFFAQR